MRLLFAAALQLIQVTSPDGARVDLNPNEIVFMRAPRENELRTSHKDVGCIIFTADGKFVSAKERCAEVRHAIQRLDEEIPP